MVTTRLDQTIRRARAEGGTWDQIAAAARISQDCRAAVGQPAFSGIAGWRCWGKAPRARHGSG